MRYNNLMLPRTSTTNPGWVHYQAAVKVARLLNRAGFDAYLIGGAVRDVLMGRLPKDFDLVTNAKPAEILKLPDIGQAKYLDPAQAFGITLVKVPVKIDDQEQTSTLEIATYRRDIEAHLGRKQTRVEYATLEDDVQRRDLTINALALDLANDYLVDLVGGLDDIKAELVRFIGQPEARIQEDPLRILRAIRLKVQLDFKYEPLTEAALRQTITQGQLKQIATERLRQELSRLLVHSTRKQAIEELDEFGVINQILPELSSTKRVKQPKQFHSEGDVWRHTLLAIDNLEGVPSERLAWATLLHDIGKPPTFQPASQTGDRIRFSDHYNVGADLARQALNRLGFPKRLVADVSWMIAKHMGIDDLPKMRVGRQQEFMAHPAFVDLLALHRADAHASWHLLPSGQVKIPEPEFRAITKLWHDFQDKQAARAPSLKQDLGVDGQWLKQEFGLSDGPELGKILERLEAAYLDGELTNQTDARNLVKSILGKSRPA